MKTTALFQATNTNHQHQNTNTNTPTRHFITTSNQKEKRNIPGALALASWCHVVVLFLALVSCT